MITILAKSSSGKFIISGTNDGSITLRAIHRLSSFAKCSMHNVHQRVTGVALSFDDAFLLSSGSDGLLIVHRVKPNEIVGASESNTIQQHEDLSISEQNNIDLFHIYEDKGEGTDDSPPGFVQITHSLDLTCDIALTSTQDIDGRSTSSLRQERNNNNKKAREVAAEKEKQKARNNISGIRKDYEAVVKRNKSLPVNFRLTDEELIIDTAYREMLLAKREHLLLEIQKERLYDTERIALHLKKLQNKYINCLDYEHFTVMGMKSGIEVNSFVTEKMLPQPNKCPAITSVSSHERNTDEPKVKSGTSANVKNRAEKKIPSPNSPSNNRLSTFDKRKV